MYTVLLNILLLGLTPYADENIWYQCGFWHNMSTTDICILSILQILMGGVVKEYNEAVHQLIIYFS
jgi:hypothetical protein